MNHKTKSAKFAALSLEAIRFAKLNPNNTRARNAYLAKAEDGFEKLAHLAKSDFENEEFFKSVVAKLPDPPRASPVFDFDSTEDGAADAQRVEARRYLDEARESLKAKPVSKLVALYKRGCNESNLAELQDMTVAEMQRRNPGMDATLIRCAWGPSVEAAPAPAKGEPSTQAVLKGGDNWLTREEATAKAENEWRSNPALAKNWISEKVYVQHRCTELLGPMGISGRHSREAVPLMDKTAATATARKEWAANPILAKGFRDEDAYVAFRLPQLLSHVFNTRRTYEPGRGWRNS